MTTTFYDEIGGEATIRTIVHRFYEGVAGDDVLRPMYPEADLGPAEERFALFLIRTGVARRRTATRAGTRGSGCAMRRSRSPRPPPSTG